MFRLLARLTRSGVHLLLTAPEPDHWFPTGGRVDQALQDQGRLLVRIHEAGGDLDGVYYVPRSLFHPGPQTREQALRDILTPTGHPRRGCVDQRQRAFSQGRRTPGIKRGSWARTTQARSSLKPCSPS